MGELTNGQVWEAAQAQLQMQMTAATFDTWIKDTTLISVEGDTYVLGVQSAFAKDWLENRLYMTLQRTLSSIIGKPGLELSIVINGNGAKAEPAQQFSPEAACPEPGPDEIGVELVSFDPTQRGWVQTSNYAIRFWQPLLGQPAFILWLTLRSFAFQANHKDIWPAIETLADICTNGNRHKLLGRAARQGRAPVIGAIKILEQQRIIWVKAVGRGRQTKYYFRVLDNLPLLTPQQVTQLTPRLQEAHQRFLKQCQIDYEEWAQLTLPSLLKSDL